MMDRVTYAIHMNFSFRKPIWIEIRNLVKLVKLINPLNAELNPIRHLPALVGAHHIVHVSRIRVNPLNAELNPIRHLLALVGARHIVHVSRVRVKPLRASGYFMYHHAPRELVCFTYISARTAIISLCSINWLVFITDGGECLLRGTDWILKCSSGEY